MTKLTQQVRHDPVGTVAYAANAPVRLDIPRLGAIAHLNLQLSGQLTCTLGNNTLANTKRGGEWACITKMEVVRNGSDVLATWTPDFLLNYNRVMLGILPDLEPTIGDGATANPSFASCATMFFALPTGESYNGLDFALPAPAYSKLELVVYWASSYTDVNGSAAGFATSPTLQVSQFYRFGGAAGKLKYADVRRAITTVSPDYSGAATNQDIKLTTNRVYAQLLINTRNSSDVDAGGLVQNIKIRSGSAVFRTYPTDRLMREEYRSLRGRTNHFNRALNSGVGGIGQPFQSAKSAVAGWQPVEFRIDGRNTESFDTRGWTEAIVTLDTTAACKVNIFSVEIQG